MNHKLIICNNTHFPEDKTALELGLQAGDKIIVVDNSKDGADTRVPNGTTLTLDDDLDSSCPWCLPNSAPFLRGCAYADPKKMEAFVKAHPEWYKSKAVFASYGTPDSLEREAEREGLKEQIIRWLYVNDTHMPSGKREQFLNFLDEIL